VTIRVDAYRAWTTPDRAGPPPRDQVGRPRSSSGRAATRPSRLRTSEEIALTEADGECPQGRELIFGLDPLRDEGGTGTPCEVHHSRHESSADRVLPDRAHEADVDLHEVRAQLDDVAEARVPRAGIVDREPDGGSEALDGSTERQIVVDHHMFGDLEDDRQTRPDQEARETVVLDHQIG